MDREMQWEREIRQGDQWGKQVGPNWETEKRMNCRFSGGAGSGSSSSKKKKKKVEKNEKRLPCVNGFQLQRLLGQGSFGRVYLCKHRETGQVACVKLESLDTTAAQVTYEHRLYESLKRTPAAPFVPRSLCCGQSGDYRYLVLALGGKDLSSIIDTYSVKEKLEVFRNLVAALHAFHDAGIVHRDIKPRNILLNPEGGKTDIWLVDLGLTKRYKLCGMHGDNCRKTSAVGTSRYSSVHSQMFCESSRRDDMYSCIYTAVSIFGRKLPWEGLKGTSKQKTIETLRRKRFLPPSVVCRGCPPCVARIYQHVQQLSFKDRPQYQLYMDLITLDIPPDISPTTSSVVRYPRHPGHIGHR